MQPTHTPRVRFVLGSDLERNALVGQYLLDFTERRGIPELPAGGSEAVPITVADEDAKRSIVQSEVELIRLIAMLNSKLPLVGFGYLEQNKLLLLMKQSSLNNLNSQLIQQVKG